MHADFFNQINPFSVSFSTGEKAEGFPQVAGGQQGPRVSSGAAEGRSISPAAV